MMLTKKIITIRYFYKYFRNCLTKKDIYYLNYSLKVQIKDGDLKADFKWSEAVIVDQILLCTSSNCDDSTPYFSIDSKNSGGETYDAEFTLRTIRSIPNYGETSFFTEIKLIIQVYNSKERFAYDCSKADEIASSKCYNDESELPDII
jgi:hypothetical protein